MDTQKVVLLKFEVFVSLAIMQTQNSKGCQFFGGTDVKNLSLKIFLILQFYCNAKFCVDMSSITGPFILPYAPRKRCIYTVSQI